MNQFWLLVLLGSTVAFESVAQIPAEDISTHVDSSCACAFLLPNWFIVRPSREYRDIHEVWESVEYSFNFSAIDLQQANFEYEHYVGSLSKDSSDIFLQTVKQETFFTGCVNYHGLVQYARLDSLKELVSKAGLRVIATYRTIVSVDGHPIDNEKLGPLYFVDTLNLGTHKILKFDFSRFDNTNSVYSKLALSIALSVRPI